MGSISSAWEWINIQVFQAHTLASLGAAFLLGVFIGAVLLRRKIKK